MLTTKEGIRFFISSKTGIAVLAISVILICSILWYLIYRFIIFKKRKLKLIAGENLGPEEWEKQMIALARSHGRVKPSKYNFALDDYNQTAYKKLNRIRKTISRLSTDIIYLIPAARWLFDNFQIMYREIKKIRSSGTSYEILPVIKAGPEKGYPRIYVLAKHMVLLSGGHLDRENIILMVKAYQTECKLTDKELWVLPEMLGFCLLESIIEVSEDILRIIKLKSKAEKFVKDHLAAGQGGQDITPLLRKTDMDCRDDFSFHAHVVYLLKNMSVDHGLIQKYLDYHCIAKDLKLNSLFLEEGRIEAGHEARIRTLIISLREINELDSETLFEELSVLEQILLRDPEGYYGSMDAESRGMYREVIVKLARRHRMEEERVAFACLKLAQEGRKDLSHPHHVGSYLLGKGYPVLKCRALGKTEPTKLKRKLNVKGFLYFAVSALLLFGILFGLALLLKEGTDLPALKKLLLLLASLPLLIGIAMEISVFLFTRGILVKRLPALDYRKSIPDHARTFVVMPVILSSKEQGLEYLNRIERLYLANRQENLYYALLADYEDASEPTLPKDKIIEEALLSRLEELNKAYPSPHMRFSLFTRYRKWNESEGCYMCWERKRGKLEEFNSLMCGERKEKTSFETICGCDELFGSFKYVITLDADSNLIWDNAAKLVGLMEHPLNQPVLDMQRRRVREGYAIIQPSVRNHIIDRKGSLFTMIFGGQSGLDHYSAVISDIYQDIFNQGTYIGKGIYHIEAFHTLLHGTIPENSVLSHDLLESCYARTAFSSSVKIMDTFPGSVLSYVKREHRWIRGDWQLLPWLFLRKTADHRKVCALSKWKIADNLRRSMVPLSKTLLILANLAWLPDLPLWFPLVFFSDLFNILVMLLSLLKQKLLRPKLAFVYRSFLKELGIMLERAFLELVLTPYRAYIATDAAIRTLFRLFISRKNLLRWNTAESVDASIINTKKGYFLSMWSSLLAAALLLWLILARELSTLEFIVFGSVALLWTTAFLTAYYISLPREESDWEEPPEDLELLQQTAFRTWLFFKEFATKERNWLCPDNFQETHRSRISDKTSPTNIGLQFLSLLSARDLGYESLTSFLTQVENLLITVGKLPKYRGHLYNWYGVHSLEILNPAYISTVDSGNFLGHMIALKQGLAEQADQPILYKSSVKHLQSLLKLSNHNGKLKEDYRGIGEFIDDIRDIWEDMEGRNRLPCEEPRWCRRLSEMIEALVEDASAFQLKDSTFFSCPTLRQLAQKDHRKAKLMMEKIRELTARIDQVVENADFSFLYNEKRMLFHIGFHVDSQTLDAGCYDLIASESALTSFLCVARGEVPLKHWYKLGRPLTMIKGIPCFVSWSGTMFEYLMPNLVMKEYEGSVFAETARAAVLQHMKYARQMGIPWGISESQYFRFDLYSNYQYKAFGVPKLRLQPVRRTSLVVAPYASLLALEYAGRECLANLRRMMKMGVYGEYGFYEAVDFNGPDAGEMTPYRIVKSFMAHHQGMNLVAINNYLNHGIMRRRFHAEPMIRAAEVLLEEKRQNHLVSTAKRGYTINFSRLEFKQVAYGNRYVAGTAPASPVAGYLSNQKYSLMLTSDGDGFSSYEDRMIYRFRADPHANTGQYFYIRESGTGRVWSCAYHPTGREPEEYQVIFSHHGMDIKRRDGDISTHTTISLSPEHPMEIRKLVLTNHGKQTRQLEITSYMEIVSDSHLAELSHPAFNKLFIESEFIEGHAIFLSRRRSRKTIEKPYIMHMVRTGATLLKPVEYENDRLNFIGRNHSPADPEAILSGKPLSNRSGFSNDPIMSLKVSVSLEAEEKVSLYFMTGVCDSREEAIKIGEELNVPYRIEDLLEKYRLQSEIELKYLEISKQQLNAFQDMISPIFYPNRSYRGPELKLRRNVRNQSFLWKFGVSGDNPILLLTVDSIEQEGVIRDVLKAYEYLRINRVMADLIILIDGKHGYLQKVDDLINDLTSALKVYDSGSEKPSFYVLHTYQMIPAEIDLLYTVARIVFNDRTGIYFKDSKGNLKAYMDERYG